MRLEFELGFGHSVKLKLCITAKRLHTHHSCTSYLDECQFGFRFKERAASHDHSKQHCCYSLAETSFDTETEAIAASYHSGRNLAANQKLFISYFAAVETVGAIECEVKLRSTLKQLH